MSDQHADADGADMMAVSRLPGGWLPPRSVRMIAMEDREERRQARTAERQRAERAEQRHNEAIAAFRADAELRGDVVTVQDMISGQSGRTVGEILARVRDEAEARDAAAERWRPGGRGPDEVMFEALTPEPAPAARSALAREVANVRRHFEERREARRKADALQGRGPVYVR